MKKSRLGQLRYRKHERIDHLVELTGLEKMQIKTAADWSLSVCHTESPKVLISADFVAVDWTMDL